MIEMIPDFVWLKDNDGVYRTCNLQFERIFGAKTADILGKTDYDFLDRELADFLRKKDKEAISFDKPRMNEEEIFIVGDGQKKILETIKRPMYDPSGKLVGVLGIARDITERKQAEEKIQELNQSLEEMVYVASHDLQVPLVSMEGFASELLDTYKERLDEEGVYCLTRLQANARRMHTLVLSLLDMSRLNTKINPPTVFEAREVIDHAIWDSELLIEKSKTKIEFKNVPRIFGDKLRIITVFRNLITNAIIYGGDKIIIGYRDKMFYIQDNGIGIPINQLEKIFSPTERLKMVDVEGVGMGLTFCKKVIRQHGGKIWAESEGLNKGATFYFMLKPEKQDKG